MCSKSAMGKTVHDENKLAHLAQGMLVACGARRQSRQRTMLAQEMPLQNEQERVKYFISIFAGAFEL